MEFSIKKNKHKDCIWKYFPKFSKYNTLDFYFEFDKSCLYELDANQNQINKLIGFSYGHHHNNSVRIGWTGDELSDKIVLYSYVYNNGVRHENKITEVFTNSLYEGVITYDESRKELTYKICLNGKSIFHKEKIDFHVKFGYLLRPYFGGKEKAPHDMQIDLIIKK